MNKKQIIDQVEQIIKRQSSHPLTAEEKQAIKNKWIDICRKIGGRQILKVMNNITIAISDQYGNLQNSIDDLMQVSGAYEDKNARILKNSRKICCCGSGNHKGVLFEENIDNIVFIELTRIGNYDRKFDIYQLVFITDDSEIQNWNYIYHAVLHISRNH